MASYPASGLIAVATDTPTMEFSSGGEVLVADAGLGSGFEVASFSDNCIKKVISEKRFQESFKDGDFTGTSRDIKGNPVWDNTKKRWFNHAEEMRGNYTTIHDDIRVIGEELRNNRNLNSFEKSTLKKRVVKLQKISGKIAKEVGTIEQIESAADYIKHLNSELKKLGVRDLNTAKKMLQRNNRLRGL